MIPIRDSPQSRTRPYVTYVLIAINIFVFFYELSLSDRDLNQFFFDWGVVPRILTDYLHSPSASAWDELLRPVTTQFIHGGWLHVLGNMLFLWIFGDNVEDTMGHRRYLVFYLVAGYVAATLQAFTDPNDVTPVVGASGAIAGVLGAYLVLYPTASVTVLLPFLFFLPAAVPALLMLAVWFLMQVFSGLASIGYATGAAGGTAWWAHGFGFVLGMVLGRVLATQRRSYILRR